VGRTWAGAARTQPLGEYTVMTLKCTALLGKKANAFITLDNLFNRRYQVVAGYPMPGINAIGGFNFRF